MGLIRGVSCAEFQHDFVAWTFALIAPFQPVLHWVLQGNKTVPNASKQYETYQNLSLGSNGVDMERSLWKIHNFVARTFSLIAPVQPKLLRVLYSNKMILNALKPNETH